MSEKSNNIHFDADLYDFKLVGNVATGYVFNDKRNQFDDGSRIYTSRVIDFIQPEEDGQIFIQTMNTTYRAFRSPHESMTKQENNDETM